MGFLGTNPVKFQLTVLSQTYVVYNLGLKEFREALFPTSSATGSNLK